jgi:hypothetical protein
VQIAGEITPQTTLDVQNIKSDWLPEIVNHTCSNELNLPLPHPRKRPLFRPPLAHGNHRRNHATGADITTTTWPNTSDFHSIDKIYTIRIQPPSSRNSVTESSHTTPKHDRPDGENDAPCRHHNDLFHITLWNTLRILQWNANSVYQRKEELENFLFTNKIDVAAICETKLHPRRTFNMPGYSTHKMDRNQYGEGVLLLIRNTLLHDRINLPITPTMETVAVIVRDTQQRKLLIISGYAPASTTLSADDLTTIFAHKIPTVLLGDFNSKHTAWRCSRNNRAGNILLDFCINHGVNIYAPDHATYVNTRGQANVLDLALGYGYYLSQPHSVPCLSSDHNPVVCKIRFTPHATEQR